MEIAMLDDADFAVELEQIVLPKLRECAEEGYMEPAETDYRGMPLNELNHPGKIHYVCYDVHKFRKLQVPGASPTFHGAVVLSHGFSEFARKFDELAWYYLLAGFSVCVIEHRGHGYSARDVNNKDIIWIDDWRRYVADLAKFCSTVGRHYADEHELCLFSHSMGGGICAAMLERYPRLIDKAVLSTPMIEANTGVPNWLAAGVCGFMSDIGRSKSKALGQKVFSPELDMSKYQNGSVNRVDWFRKIRVADEHYQTSAAANGWVKNAVRLSRAILKPQMAQRIETPILLFQAGLDSWVNNEAQDRFVKMVENAGGEIKVVRVESACHEIFSMPNDVMAPYLKQILRFFVQGEKVNVLP